MKINRFFFVAIIFFFVNSLGLPTGLTYTSLLAPFFYLWAMKYLKTEPVLPFVLFLTPFIVIHLINEVSLEDYVISLINIICIYIFCVAFYVFLNLKTNVDRIFRRLLYINFFLCLVAFVFYFTPYSNIFWIDQFLTSGIDEYRRLKMFTYEPSYYSLLFTPLFIYYLLQMSFKRNKIAVPFLLLMIGFPLALSFSLGVISAVLLAVLTTFLIYQRKLLKRQAIFNSLVLGFGLMIFLLAVMLIFFPDNTLFVRIANIFSGNDSSGKGRTFEAFYLAEQIGALKSPLFGIGLGQIKIIGADIIRNFYQYDNSYVITIPNAAAETLAIFGWFGLILRIGIEIFLFFYTRVWTNYYRLALFVFVFVYQFTGSFITNVAEYAIWVMVFTDAFKEFDVKAISNSASRQNAMEWSPAYRSS